MEFGRGCTLFLALSLFLLQLSLQEDDVKEDKEDKPDEPEDDFGDNLPPEDDIGDNLSPDDFIFLVSGGSRYGTIENVSRYMVSLRARTTSRFFGDNHFCAGLIVHERWILTAAHCVMSFDKIKMRPRQIIVVSGTPNRIKQQPESHLWAVRSVTTHPNFTLGNTNDIALLRLTIPLKLNAHTKVIALPKNPPPYGKRCVTLGWGRLYKDGPLAARITYVDLILFSAARCRKLHPKFVEGALCAGDDVNLDHDACRGDSGGPLVCNGEFTAIVSWTLGCGTPGLPSIYTDVYHHLSWINKVISASALRQVLWSLLLMNLVFLWIS